MRINKTDIEAIKRTHDLKAVIESYGVSLKRKAPTTSASVPSIRKRPRPLPSTQKQISITVSAAMPAEM